jgi:4-methylaminobutanoate oxidase (formaldehyde-forming)
METHARAVIVGAGIAGASIAYHLARLGWREVVVVEQGELVSGTTSHAPGLVGQLRSSAGLTRMLMYSVALYKHLRAGGVAGYQGEGSLRLASSKARLEQLRQQHRFAVALGLEAHLLGPAEAARLFPLLNREGVEGALHLPTDGSATAPVLAQALIDEARAGGVAFHPHTRVQGIEVTGGRVQALTTSAGRIATETVVVAAGIWSPRVGRLAGVSLPLTPMQHQYAATGPLAELSGQTLPNLRDPDNLVYLRQREQTLVFGGYERNPLPFDVDAIPEGPNPTVQAFDASQFETLRRQAAGRVPLLASARLERQVNGLESFTPDGEFLLGPSPAVQGFWAACGFCAHGVSSAGGVGKVLAEWIVNGDPGVDLAVTALDRFGDRPLDKPAIQQAACKVYRTYYDIPAAGPAS